MFRQMRRFKQLLPIETCQQILTTQKRSVLSLLGDDDYPYGVPMNFVYDPTRGELGSVFFHSAVEGHKLDALIAHDKASLTVMDGGERHEGEWWYYVNSVICFGRICVVEDPRDVMAFERTHEYNGTYHVLGGVISPMDGISPSDLHIADLVERASSGEISEIILALPTTMEGETTNYYINKKLQASGVKVTVIAKGIAVGEELQYTDEITLTQAIKNRKPFE